MHITIIKSDGYNWVSNRDIEILISVPCRQKIIHDGRNMLWTCWLHDKMFVVKHFRNSIKNKLLYTYVKNKAYKSWRNATELIRRGINTPEPVACVEKHNNLGCLVDCWYISLYESSISLCNAINENGSSFIERFAEFVSELHQKGVRHDDLNNTNVRVSKSDGKYVFGLIDLNRMKIYPDGIAVPLDECFKNICRFCCFDNVFEIFINAYLDKRKLPISYKMDAIEFKKRHDILCDLKKRIKNHIKI